MNLTSLSSLQLCQRRLSRSNVKRLAGRRSPRRRALRPRDLVRVERRGHWREAVYAAEPGCSAQGLETSLFRGKITLQSAWAVQRNVHKGHLAQDQIIKKNTTSYEEAMKLKYKTLFNTMKSIPFVSPLIKVPWKQSKSKLLTSALNPFDFVLSLS